MNWFKEKCSHLYEEIGKFYDRIDYGNGTHINLYCKKMQNMRKYYSQDCIFK